MQPMGLDLQVSDPPSGPRGSAVDAHPDDIKCGALGRCADPLSFDEAFEDCRDDHRFRPPSA